MPEDIPTKLTFKHPYASISAFPDFELPRLAIIIGPNGVGKSHLLEAIYKNAIDNSVVPNPQHSRHAPPLGDMRKLLLSNEAGGTGVNRFVVRSNLPPHPQPQAYVSPIKQGQPERTIVPFEDGRAKLLQHARARLDELLGQSVAQLNGRDPWRSGISELLALLGSAGASHAAELEEIFAEARQDLTEGIIPSAPDPTASAIRNDVSRAARIMDKDPLTVTEGDAIRVQHWGGISAFEPDISQIIGRYRDKLLKNELAQNKDRKNGTALSLSDDGFVTTYGRAPWEEISEVIRNFGLPYKVAAPDLDDYSDVTFEIERVDSGAKVGLDQLSSGEKVMLKFALSLFNYNEEFVGVSRPQLLLLDEMDAPLHPEMAQRWLAGIEAQLAGHPEMACLMTTHSPTTVALAPEESLYEMVSGQEGLRKVSKQDALNKLTFGVPTLSVDYSGRRQIIVESNTDASLFGKIYSYIKGSIELRKQLDFISCGFRGKGGIETNGGCSVVKELVSNLRGAGNASVFGLVDWDGEAEPSESVRVLAHGKKDGIENVLLDPVLIALLLIKGGKAPASVHEKFLFSTAGELGDDDLQELADHIQYAIIDRSECEEATMQSFYLSGKSVHISKQYAQMDDHQLEDKLRASFPYLKSFLNRRGGLSEAVVDDVIREHRGYCPADIKLIFEELSNAQTS